MFKALLEAVEQRRYLLDLQASLVEQGWDDVDMSTIGAQAKSVRFTLSHGKREVAFEATLIDDMKPADFMWQARDLGNFFNSSELEPTFGGDEEDLLKYAQAYLYDFELINELEKRGWRIQKAWIDNEQSALDYKLRVDIIYDGYEQQSIAAYHEIDEHQNRIEGYAYLTMRNGSKDPSRVETVDTRDNLLRTCYAARVRVT